jgi:hypothetical protein
MTTRRVCALLAALAVLWPAGAQARPRAPQLPARQIAAVQRLFDVLGYPLGHERRGLLGVRTRGAISYFQHKYGLPVSGRPDPRTIAAMRAVAASLRPPRPAAGGRAHDLLERLLPGVPVLGLGIGCALTLALLALAAGRKTAAEP